MIENRNPRCDLFAVILVVFALFLTVSLATYSPADQLGTLFPPLDRIYQPDVLVWPQNEQLHNACGHWGAITADVLYTTLGIGAFFLVIGVGAIALALLQRQSVEALWSKTAGWLLSLIGMTTLASMLLPTVSLGPVIGPGGYIGALGAGLMKLHFAGTGGLILATSVLAIGMFMWTEYVFVKVVGFALVSVLSVFGFLLPTGTLANVAALFRLRGSDEDYENEEEYEYEEEDEEESGEDEDDGRRRSMFADQPDEEFEHDEVEEDDEAWYEDELDDEPGTIPFVVKTAAKTAVPDIEEVEEDQENEEDESDDEEQAVEDAEVASKRGGLFGLGRKKKSSPEDERQEVIRKLNRASRHEETEDYDLPDLDLLKKSEEVPVDDVMSEITRRGKMLEQKFAEFGQNIRVVDVETGPVITQYELDLEKGLRLNKVMALADDIAVGLRVPSVRIVPSIPGKNTVGIEVPNERRQVVRIRDVMEAASEQTRKMKIPLFLGQDVSGNEMVVDLSRLPHLLIAGRTGTGKSVCLNAIINSILMTRRPDEVRMLMIDPKMVELSGYSRLPHLMHPVVTDMRKAEAILAWAVEKMEERYRLMSRAGVRHINSYNQLGEEELMERLQPDDEEREEIPVNMPFIVIVADEMADLMMTAGKEVEAHIIRLAQKSRAVGIHLILATQKPTVDVLTGLIKSNLPARISFQVASQTDSRVVLDSNGAEKLLGNGDMLFLGPNTSKLMRGQGTFVSDEEIDAIAESVSTGEQNFVHELVNMKVEDNPGEGVDDDELAAKLAKRDDLYHRAVEIVINEQRGSCSLLQRALRIGYGRAARVIDHMEEDGVVGPYNGSKHREVIMTMDQWRYFQSGESENKKAEKPDQIVRKTSLKSVAPVFEEIGDDNDETEPDIALSVVDANDTEEQQSEKKGLVHHEVEADWDEEEDEDDEEVEYDEEGDDEQDEDAAALNDEDWEYEEVDEGEADEDDEYEYEYVYEDEEEEEL